MMKRIYMGVLCILLLGFCACERAAEPEETGPIEATASYQSAPAAYTPVLDEYHRKSPYAGYAVQDINSDGVPEGTAPIVLDSLK